MPANKISFVDAYNEDVEQVLQRPIETTAFIRMWTSRDVSAILQAGRYRTGGIAYGRLRVSPALDPCCARNYLNRQKKSEHSRQRIGKSLGKVLIRLFAPLNFHFDGLQFDFQRSHLYSCRFFIGGSVRTRRFHAYQSGPYFSAFLVEPT
jgi:hypothetical protein